MTTTMVKREPAIIREPVDIDEVLPGGAPAENHEGGEEFILAGVAAGLLIVLVLFVLIFDPSISRLGWQALR